MSPKEAVQKCKWFYQKQFISGHYWALISPQFSGIWEYRREWLRPSQRLWRDYRRVSKQWKNQEWNWFDTFWWFWGLEELKHSGVRGLGRNGEGWVLYSGWSQKTFLEEEEAWPLGILTSLVRGGGLWEESSYSRSMGGAQGKRGNGPGKIWDCNGVSRLLLCLWR